MFVRWVDGKAVFPIQYIRYEGENLNNLNLSEEEKQALESLDLDEKENVIAIYTDNNIKAAIKILESKGIAYKLAEAEPNVFSEKAKGVRYRNRTEMMKHLLHDEEPKSLEIPNVKKAVVEAEDALLGMMFRRGNGVKKFLDKKFDEGKVAIEDLNFATFDGLISIEEEQELREKWQRKGKGKGGILNG